MKEIKLTGKYGTGKVCFVDDDDFEYLNKWKWCLDKGYPKRGVYNDTNHTIGKEVMLKHGLYSETLYIDHINGNKLDNRKTNLRMVNEQQSASNRPKMSGCQIKYKGVTRNRGKFRANIYPNGKKVNLGTFLTEIEAALAYKIAAKNYYGEFARINI